MLLVASGEGVVKLFDSESGLQVGTLKGLTDSVQAIAQSGSRSIRTGCSDGSLTSWRGREKQHNYK